MLGSEEELIAPLLRVLGCSGEDQTPPALGLYADQVSDLKLGRLERTQRDRELMVSREAGPADRTLGGGIRMARNS